MKYLLLLLMVLPALLSAQIHGKITDENGKPIVGATISIQNTYLGTSSNSEGDYEIKLPSPGNYTLSVYKIGYDLASKSVTVKDKPIQVNWSLSPVQKVIETVTIRNTGNPADRIMREAIKHRRANGRKYDRYRVNFYSKGILKVVNLPEKILGKKLDEDDSLMDDLQLDSTRSGIVYLSETMSEVAFDRPNKFSETVKASKVSGDDKGYSFNTAMDANFDFYANNVSLLDQVISPLADQAFSYYQYELVQSFESGDHLIYEIKVKPRRLSEPVVYGSIFLIDQSWEIYAVDVAVKGSSVNQPIIDSLIVQQQYVYHPEDAIWAKQSQNIQLGLGIFNIKLQGRFDHVFSDHEFVTSFAKGTFGKTIITVEKESNKFTTVQWQEKRPFVLKDEENTNYHKRDSIQVIRNSPAYIDSLDRVANTFKASNMLFGYTYRNSQKKQSIGYGLLDELDKVQYNAVQGLVLNLHVHAKQERINGFGGTYFNSDISYGFADEKFRFEGQVNHRFKSKQHKLAQLKGGSTLKQFNSDEPITPFINSIASLFFNENFIRLYQRDYLQGMYEQTIIPELTLGSSLSYNRRSPLFINTHYSFIDRDIPFASNDPLDPTNYDNAPFASHHIAKWNLNATINPGRKVVDRPDGYHYIQQPYMPLIKLEYERGFASDYNFHFVGGSAREDVSIGNKGDLQVFARAGTFFDAENMSFIDFKHFNGNQTHIGSASGYLDRFMILPYYTHSTNARFVETHVEHHFNGFILNKIPLINRLGFVEVIGHHHFSVRDKPSYHEFTVGLDKLGWGKFRLFRLDYVRSFQGAERQSGWVLGMKFLRF